MALLRIVFRVTRSGICKQKRWTKVSVLSHEAAQRAATRWRLEQRVPCHKYVRLPVPEVLCYADAPRPRAEAQGPGEILDRRRSAPLPPFDALPVLDNWPLVPSPVMSPGGEKTVVALVCKVCKGECDAACRVAIFGMEATDAGR